MDGSADNGFTAYVAQRRPALLRAASAITGDPHLAEDLVQAALLRVGARWHAIRDPRAVDAYVRRTMLNQYRTWCREPWSSRIRVTDEVPETATSDDPVPVDQRPLWALVTALPPRQRAAVALRYYEGLTERETAEVLHCSLGVVKSNTSRGIATLRRWTHPDPERYIA